MTAPRKPTDQELIDIGSWAMWALRQPNALELFQESGAKCVHGTLCQDCLEEARTEISRIASGQEEAQG